MTMIFLYLATGILAGTMSGLLGLGGGIVVVPALAALFLHHAAIPPAIHMHMAVGTSLAIMIVTYLSGVYAHNKRKTIHWSIVKTVFPGLVLGIMIGSVIIRFFSSAQLMKFFGFFLFFIAMRLLFFKDGPSMDGVSRPIAKPWVIACSFGIGILSSLLGVGGGVLWVPFFLYGGLKMHEAVGTSVACGMVAAMVATSSFMLTGAFSTLTIPRSVGFIYWPAFLGVSIMSVLFAPLGAFIAYRLSNRLLKLIFAAVLLAVAIQMIFFT